MLELLIDKSKLKLETPPRMEIGSFWTFKNNNNLFGIGQQAVHNSGSSMMIDTPTFKQKVLHFLDNHIEFEQTDINVINDLTENDFFRIQSERLNRFKNDLDFRLECLDNIFVTPFVFSSKISVNNLFIALMLYFIKNYNYFLSSHTSHSLTKREINKYFHSEGKLLEAVNNKLRTEKQLGYLLDVCFGRYYFLEVHFENKNSDGQIRNTPLLIIREFFEASLQKTKFILSEDEIENEIEQKRILKSTGYTDTAEIENANNRIPELAGSSSKRYKTNSRLSKTVLIKNQFRCEVDSNHTTFKTKKDEDYMEAHHLIPMAFQKDYLPINIDREENVVSLCPNCHRAIHYGSNIVKKDLLEVLFYNKIYKLTNTSINIDFSKLLEYYKIE